ncbi:hypothetical protein KKF82_05850 [Patescibacteria group bacterium]|nr:hypothetical protein [Patescibacteria group bacterium]
MIPLLPIAISLATKFVPSLINKLIGPKAGEVAERVVGIATSVTGLADPEKSHDKIMADPNLQLEFEKATMDLQLALYQEDTRRLETINETMQSESKSTSLAQRTWRPFNGFLFGITLFCDYFIAQIVFMVLKAKYSGFLFTWEHIPPSVYMLWAGVLGVAAGTRGWEKVSAEKSKNGKLNMEELVKVFGQGIIGK